MSKPKRTDTQSPALHVADRHDLIGVQSIANIKFSLTRFDGTPVTICPEC